jgi:hypothetical protein
MAAPHDLVQLPLTLHLTSEARETVAKRAAAIGADEAEYISTLVERSAHQPFSLVELSGPVYKRFLSSGISDDQLSQELERAKHELRAERRNRRAS